MDNDIKDITPPNKPKNNGKVLIGFVLLAVGGILLLRQITYFDIPGWVWGWPTWLILWGLYCGAKSDFRNPSCFIMVFIGGAFLLDDAIPDLHIGNLIWPAAIILLGVWLIMRRNYNWKQGRWDHKWDKEKWEQQWKQKWDAKYHQYTHPTGQPVEGDTTPPPNFSADDFLDATSIFGGSKKTVLSKNFRGGDITNIFGGAEIDLTMADIDGRVVIDITQVFGGTKIIVPPHWQVVSNMSAVFAGVDDKRLRKVGAGDNNKVLVLEGVSIFAGVDIRSF